MSAKSKMNFIINGQQKVVTKVSVKEDGKKKSVLRTTFDGQRVFDRTIWLIKDGELLKNPIFNTTSYATIETDDHLRIVAKKTVAIDGDDQLAEVVWPIGEIVNDGVFKENYTLVLEVTCQSTVGSLYYPAITCEVTQGGIPGIPITERRIDIGTTWFTDQYVRETVYGKYHGYPQNELTTYNPVGRINVGALNYASSKKTIEITLDVYNMCLLPTDLLTKYGPPWQWKE